MNILNELPASMSAHIPIKAAILQAGIADQAQTICAGFGKTLVICDENTKDFVKAPGEKLVLPAKQKAELATAQKLSQNPADCFVAVGSGSLNDIVKYAAHLANKPYIVFATAPSMNGYVSANASLLEQGYKKSFAARAPQAAYFDLEIMATAPRRLINSGIGDAICRSTAEADALLSAQGCNTPDYAELFALLRTYEDAIFDDISALVKTLVFGGLAMLLAKSSAPASQGEHMLAHYMELMQPQALESFHGEQIAVTTLTMARLQAQLLAAHEEIKIPEIDEGKILQHFGNDFGRYCVQQTRAKYLQLDSAKLNKAEIENAMLPAETLHKKLQAIGAPLTAKDIGWDEEIYNEAINFSRYTRDRFTFLDLV